MGEKNKDRATEEAWLREEFADWPNVVATVKLFLDKDGDLNAVYQFDGPKVKEMGLSDHEAAKVKAISQLVMRDVEKALMIGALVGSMLDALVGGENDNKGEGSGESGERGSDGGEQQHADAASSVSGDGEGGPVRSVGREEDAPDRVSD